MEANAQKLLLHLSYMLLSRRFDERFEALRLTGGVSKWYSAVGNEATTVAAGMALERGDTLVTLHRDLGAILSVYLDPRRTFPGLFAGESGQQDPRPDPQSLLRRLACQMLGRDEGFSRGIERSFHYAFMSPAQGIQHLGMISHLGSMIPVAAGCAWAQRLQGGDRVAINFIGDGGTSTGDFHEALNIAAVWKLPLVLIIENNRYAFSTPASDQYACERLSDRGFGYGIAAETVDGNQVEVVSSAIDRAISRARRGEGPTLIEAMLGRIRGHSEGDDSIDVVPENDRQRYLEEDPLPCFMEQLRQEEILGKTLEDELEGRIAELVEDAVDYGLQAAQPRSETATRPVFAPHIESDEPGASPPVAELSYVDAVNTALQDSMEHDHRVVLLGQDIGVFEGAFRATQGLHERWPERVRDTPIAESGTLGVAAGAAALGYRPVIEMQFADFISCGFNQLVNVIAKLFYRCEIPCPVVVRLPSGGGVGAGAFHSQNPEGWFTHTPGLKVVCPASADDAYWLLRRAIEDPNPVVFCEHKFLYRRIKGSISRSDDSVLGRARVLRDGADLTLIGYGASTWTCLQAAERLSDQGIESTVVDLRTLVPLDEETVLRAVAATGRVVVVHEATRTGGFGAEVAARIAEGSFAWLDAPVARVAFADRPVPYAKSLEKELMPSVDRIVSRALETMAF